MNRYWTDLEVVFLPNVFMWLLFKVNIFLSSTTFIIGDGEVSGRCQPFHQWLLEEYFSCSVQIPGSQVSRLLLCTWHNDSLLSSSLFPVEMNEIINLSRSGLEHLYLCIWLPDILAVCGVIRQWMYSHHFFDHVSLRPSSRLRSWIMVFRMTNTAPGWVYADFGSP